MSRFAQPIHACLLGEGGDDNHVELHCRRRDIERLEPFDVAISVERFGHRRLEFRATIVFRRFYDFCIAHGLKARRVPVRIDEQGDRAQPAPFCVNLCTRISQRYPRRFRLEFS